jgi:hypothetical protein
MKLRDLCWAAGIVDGEGCITIIKHKASSRRGCINPVYVLNLRVTMGHEPTIRRLHAIFQEGSVQPRPARNQRENDSYTWIALSRQAVRVIRALQPYLVTKAEEAWLALSFAKLLRAPCGPVPLSPEMVVAREEHYWAMRKLKPRWRFYATKACNGIPTARKRRRHKPPRREGP